MTGSTHPLTRSPSPWLSYVTRRQNPRLRLFCLPFAGGGAEFYRDWASLLPNDIEVWPVQLPGRSTRMMEPSIDAMAPLVGRLAEAIAPYLTDMPFAFFGHSMGALISFELSHRLRDIGHTLPAAVFLSGRAAPSYPVGRLKHLLPDGDLIEELKHFGGTPREVLDSPELLALILPILRNDLKLLETYYFDSRRRPLDIPLYVSGGDTDNLVPVESLAGWTVLSTRSTHTDVWMGGHFYLVKHKTEFLQTLCARLATRRSLTAGKLGA